MNNRDEAVMSLLPYLVYGAIDNSKYGMEPPLWNLIAGFTSLEDAQEYLKYRQENPRGLESLFEIEER